MFNLEKLERAVIIFLLFALLSGLGIIAYRKTHSAINLEVKNFSEHFEDGKNIDEFINKAKTVNINEAERVDLMRLKGIGKTLAGRILDYRSEVGSFGSKEELKNVKGIGERLFDGLKDDISVE